MAWTGDEASFQGFVDQHGLTFPQLNDESGSLFARFGVPYQPAWAFVAADGTVRVHNGAFDEAELDAALAELAGT